MLSYYITLDQIKKMEGNLTRERSMAGQTKNKYLKWGGTAKFWGTGRVSEHFSNKTTQ